MAMVSLKGSINEINNEKVVATTLAFTGTTAQKDLSAVLMPLGGPDVYVCRAAGYDQPLLVLQADQDFYYNFGTTTGSTVAATTGTFVRAGDQEYVRPAAQPKRVYLNVIRSSTSGTLVISVAKTSGTP